MTIALWLVATLMIALGLAGTLLPALPGVLFVFGGVALGAWIDDFALVSGLTVALVGVLAVFAWLIDYLAAVAGARRVNASREAVVGALAGTVLGIFSGLWGLLFMPLAGAAIGEYMARRDLPRAGTVGLATWLGMFVGAIIKLAISFAMVGMFIVALLF